MRHTLSPLQISHVNTVIYFCLPVVILLLDACSTFGMILIPSLALVLLVVGVGILLRDSFRRAADPSSSSIRRL